MAHALSAEHGLLRAFDNLFSNAVNYTPEGNESRVNLTADRLTMTYTSVSMSKEMCRKAFEPIVNEHSVSVIAEWKGRPYTGKLATFFTDTLVIYNIL